MVEKERGELGEAGGFLEARLACRLGTGTRIRKYGSEGAYGMRTRPSRVKNRHRR